MALALSSFNYHRINELKGQLAEVDREIGDLKEDMRIALENGERVLCDIIDRIKWLKCSYMTLHQALYTLKAIM